MWMTVHKLGSYILQKGGNEDVHELLSIPSVANAMQRMYNADSPMWNINKMSSSYRQGLLVLGKKGYMRRGK